MWGHVEDRLAAYAEGALMKKEASDVAAHLARCARCEAMRRETERGLALLRGLPSVRLPRDRADRVRRALADAAAGSPMRRRERRWMLAAAAAVLLAAGGTFLFLRGTPRLRLETAREPLTPFERTAVALERGAELGTLGMEVTSDSPAVVQRWVYERTGLGASLALQRPAEDTRRFELVGAREVVLEDGRPVRAAAVAYRIDGRPAVLLMAGADEVRARPAAWTLTGKTVRRHVDPATGVTLLTWTNSGQLYTLASRLGGLGLEGCFVCHTDAKRRRLIREFGQGR